MITNLGESILITREHGVNILSAFERDGTIFPSRIYETPIDQFQLMNRLANWGSHGLLPSNVRYIRKIDSDTTLYIVEESPKIRTIGVQMDGLYDDYRHMKRTGHDHPVLEKIMKEGHEKRIYRFHLQFPHIIYGLKLNEKNHA